MKRDLAKTITFAVLHFTVGFAVSFILTGSVAIASAIAVIEPLVNSVVFYFHERGWNFLDKRSTKSTVSVRGSHWQPQS
jgi:uncharacterized membrane protein